MQYNFVEFDKEEIEKLHKRIGDNVKNLRNQRGLTQLDLSHLIGNKSVSLISCAEVGLYGKRFNIEHLYKIAKVLDVEICEFFK